MTDSPSRPTDEGPSQPLGGLRGEIRQDRPFASPGVEAYLNLQRTAEVLHGEVVALLKAHGLSAPQYNVLRILRGAHPEGYPCAEIGTRMVTRVPDVTRLVDRLETAGYVERSRAAHDRRVVNVTILPRGLEALAALDEPVLDLHARQFGAFSADDLRELVRLLEKARERTGRS